MIDSVKKKLLLKKFKVATFYCFVSLDENLIISLLNEVIDFSSSSEIKGMVLFAREGINGTICGSAEGITAFFERIRPAISGKNCEIKYSWCNKQAFRRFRARHKKEIVTMGLEDVKPNELVGEYVQPLDWHNYLDDPETIVIDTRNEYEIAVGTFKGALNPHTETFRDFPQWVHQTLWPLVEQEKPKNIALFCTGGIRCEKATSFLRSEGFKGVNHLHGGILRYLEQVPKSDSRWEGECFVFDRRVALNHELSPGIHRLCNACGMPLSPQDREKPNYIRGVQCHYCEARFTEQDRKRFAERQKHIDDLSKRFPGNTFWPTPIE